MTTLDALRLAQWQKAKPTDLLAWQCHVAGLPEPKREAIFHPDRKWRFDLSWREHMLAVEVDGGVWLKGEKQGRHTRGKGYSEDCAKGAAALLLGWRVLHCTPEQVTRGLALAWIEQALAKPTI